MQDKYQVQKLESWKGVIIKNMNKSESNTTWQNQYKGFLKQLFLRGTK